MQNVDCAEQVWLCERIETLQKDLSNYFERMPLNPNNIESLEPLQECIKSLQTDLGGYLARMTSFDNQTAVYKAYKSFLTEKLSKAPEQAISDACEDLLFLVNSAAIYIDLAEFSRIQGVLTSSFVDCLPSDTRAELLSTLQNVTSRLLSHGISQNWLLRQGLIVDGKPDVCDTLDISNVSYKKVKGGVRIDSINESGDIVIPDFINGLPVIKIGEGAFRKRKNITSVVLPKYLLEIDKEAFSYTQIPSITIPDSVEIIGEKAFYCCKKLESVKLSQNLRHIKAGTFRECELLTSVAIPTSVTYIGDWAFGDCPKLKGIQIPDSVSRIGYGFIPDKTIIYCNNGSRAARYAEESYRIKQKAFDAFNEAFNHIDNKSV